MVKVEYGGQGGMGDAVPHPNYWKIIMFISLHYFDDVGKTRYAVVDRAHGS